MSVSAYVRGIIPPDETWQKMRAIWDACEAAGVMVPREVEDFFGGEAPDPAGVVVEVAAREWKDDTGEGYEVDLGGLPEHVKTIRFWNTW